MKSLRTILLFFIGSFVILLVLSLTYFNFYQNNPDEIQHLRLEDWSQPAKIAANVPTGSYDILLNDEGYSFFTIEDDDGQRIIKQKDIDFNGEIKAEAEPVSAGQIVAPRATSVADEDYLFYFAGSSSSDQTLKSQNLTAESDPVTLQDDISFPGSLSITETDDMLILAYSERDQELGQNILSIKGYDELYEEQIFSITHAFEQGIGYPKLASIDNEVYLAWQEINPDKMFISSDDDRFNRYLLNLSQLDTETGELEATEELGQSYGNNANIKIGEYNNELWLSWVKFDSDLNNNIIITGHLNNELDFQEFSRNPGVNPSFFVDGDEKVIINSRNLEKRGQAALFKNRFSEGDNGLQNKRIFPAFNFSSNSNIIEDEGNQHLLWTEAASPGRDIYYSNTIEPEEIGVMEFMGFNTIDSPIEMFSSLAIYFSYPVAAVQFSLGYSFVPLLILVLIIYLSRKKFKGFYNLSQDTPYVSFIGAVIFISGTAIIMGGNINDLFALSLPPEGQNIIIFIVVTLVSLGFIYFLEYDKGHSFYIGLGTVLIWLYWLSQAALVYNLHDYFI